MIIVTNPANKKILEESFQRDGGINLFGVKFVYNDHLPATQKSGKYILPDGRAVAPSDIKVSSGDFAEWGPTDWKVLLWWGIIKEEEEVVMYQINERKLMDLQIPFMSYFG